MRRRGRLVVAIAIVVAGLVSVGRPGPLAHASAVKRIDIARPGPLGAVTVIGDSVLLGAGLNSPSLPDQLAARGWGPIRFRAAGSASSGMFRVPDEFRSSYWIDLWRSQGWDARHVIVNLGVNDSGICNASVSCAYRSIMHLVDAIGPGHEIWWPTIVKSNAAHHISFNTALRQVVAERNDVHLWDWYAEYVSGGYRSGDEVHLDPAGYRRRSEVMATAFTETLGRSQRVGDDVTLPAPTGPSSTFVPTTPRRIVDTRLAGGARVAAGSRLVVDLGDHVPADATAAALYVTAARSDDRGYLSAGPCDAEPSGSTVNFERGLPRGAPAITALGTDTSVCVFTSVDAHVVVDLQGSFVADGSGIRMTPIDTPQRVHDTRATGRLGTVVVEVDRNVEAVAVNLTAARAETIGFLSAAACDAPTGTANVNFAPGPAVSASAIVPVADDGTFCVTTSDPVDVVVDLTAEFASAGDLSYVPVAPTRTLDTRFGVGGWQPAFAAEQRIDVGVVPPDAAAVTGTLALVRPSSTAFLTGDGCVGDASTSSVNAGAGAIVANSLTTGVFGGRLCIHASARSHVLFDTNGWWVAS